MPESLADFARQFLVLLKAASPNQPVYLVGGAVRDLLLKRPVHDLDFCTVEPVKSLARGLAGDLQAALFALDEERGTYRVIESRPDGSRFTYDLAVLRGGDLQTDLIDRDFTINAIALDLRHPDKLIDPLGGAQDLRDKVLRVCTPRSFENDPVRVLRAVRQSVQFELRIEPATLNLLKASVPGLERVSLERQRDELMKILSGSRPAVALRILDQVGALELILPELTGMKGVLQSPPHLLDVWEHTLNVVTELEQVLGMLAEPFQAEKNAGLWLGMASQTLGRYRPQLHEYVQEESIPERPRRGLLFLGALLHDCAKPLVRHVDEHQRVHFYTHEVEGVELVRQVARRLKLSEIEVTFLGTLVGEHMRVHHLSKKVGPASRRSIYRFFQAAGNVGPAVVLHSLADVRGTYGVTLTQDVWKAELETSRQLLEAWYEQPEVAVTPPRLVTGDDIIQLLGIRPGRIIGQILADIQEKQACGEIQTRQHALDLARQLYNQGLSAGGEMDGPQTETS
jgi:poly(A) polymerase